MIRKTFVLLWYSLILVVFSGNTCPAEIWPTYIIGPADRVRISVWDEPDFDVELPVRPDGRISLSVIGDVPAAGFTPEQLANIISRKLGGLSNLDLSKEPQVSVLVTQINSFKVHIEGEVARPGGYVFRQPTTLLQLLAQSGGVTTKADLKNSYLLRDNQKQAVDFYALWVKGNPSQNISLSPGDLVFIQNNFDSRVIIMGKVKTPRIISYKSGLTILDAVLQAGGFTEKGAQKNLKIMRYSDGQRKSFTINLDNVLTQKNASRYLNLMPKDIIIVGESAFY